MVLICKKYKEFIIYKENWYFEGCRGSYLKIKDKNGEIMKTPGCRMASEMGPGDKVFHSYKEAMDYIDNEGEKDGVFKNNKRDVLY